MDAYELWKLFKSWNRDTRWFKDMTLKTLISRIFIKILLKFANIFKNFWEFFYFSEFNYHYWSTKLFKSCRWITSKNSRNMRNVETILLNFAKNARKLEFAESIISLENFPRSLSLSPSLSLSLSLLVWVAFYFSRSWFISCTHTLSVSLFL